MTSSRFDLGLTLKTLNLSLLRFIERSGFQNLASDLLFIWLPSHTDQISLRPFLSRWTYWQQNWCHFTRVQCSSHSLRWWVPLWYPPWQTISCESFLHNCHLSDYFATILCHLQSTLWHGLHFSSHSSLQLCAYIDVDRVGDPIDRCSTTSFWFFLGNSLISWHNKK